MIRFCPALFCMVLVLLCLSGLPAPAFSQQMGPCNFAAKVHFLAPGASYDPRAFASPPQGAPVGSPFDEDLNRAFAIAPVAFQARLCGLDGVFIDQTACASVQECIGHAWGFRQRYPASGQGRFIGIPAALWQGRPAYSEFANHILHALIPLDSAVYSRGNPGADTFAMTVLAVLAHELGHVRWYDIIDPGRVGAHNPYAFCGGNFFVSWAGGAPAISRQPVWRELMTHSRRQARRAAGELRDHHRTGGHVAQIDAALGNPLVAGDLLHELYVPAAPWPDFFAAISPDEDFVETYKFKVLTSAATPLTSLPIAIRGTAGVYREDVPAAYFADRKPELAQKVGCIPL